MLGEILGVFFDRLTANDKYPGHDCENLQLLLQMQLFKKRKTFFKLSFTFPESTSNFIHFEKKNDCHT